MHKRGYVQARKAREQWEIKSKTCKRCGKVEKEGTLNGFCDNCYTKTVGGKKRDEL
jgi:hypothetical protein